MNIESLGSIVTFKSPPSVSLSSLRDSLDLAGFNQSLAKDMLPRNAFGRAARELEEGRIIRKLSEDDRTIAFQFTKEHIAASAIEYTRETTVLLNKDSGLITCVIPEIQAAAQAELNKQIGMRKSADITRLIQRLFDDEKGDLIPLREHGGVYFVPSTHDAFLEKISNLLLYLGGHLNRFEVNNAAPVTSKSVGDSVKEHLDGLISDLNKKISEFSTDASAEVAERRKDEIIALRAKIKRYQYLLTSRSMELEAAVDKSLHLFNVKLGIEEPTDEELLAQLDA